MTLLLAQSTTVPADAPAVTLGPFLLVLLAIPVLLAGEQIVRRFGWVGRSNIPAPIVGGLLAALVILLVQRLGWRLAVVDRAAHVAWQWVALPQWDFRMPAGWAVRPGAVPYVYAPLLILFFACIGLNAGWTVARRGGRPLLVFLGLAAALSVAQFGFGVLTARVIGKSPLLGLMCSGVTLMGGFGTANGAADAFEAAGLHDARLIGVAAAAFGVIAGGLLAGPLAGRLIRLHLPAVEAESAAIVPRSPLAGEAMLKSRNPGFLNDLAAMGRDPGAIAAHLLVLLACLKLGAFVTAWAGAFFSLPSYLGAMIVAVVVRNLHDLLPSRFRFLDARHIDLIAGVALAWLLSGVMISLRLVDLTTLATPMFAILLVQVAMMAAVCYWVVFRVMGRDYDAAMMTAGMVGFGLGATSNAVASMRSLALRYGPSPQAFLVVTLVGGFLIDFVNSILITACLNAFKPK